MAWWKMTCMLDWQKLEPWCQNTGAAFKRNAANFFFGTDSEKLFDSFNSDDQHSMAKYKGHVHAFIFSWQGLFVATILNFGAVLG